MPPLAGSHLARQAPSRGRPEPASHTPTNPLRARPWPPPPAVLGEVFQRGVLRPAYGPTGHPTAWQAVRSGCVEGCTSGRDLRHLGEGMGMRRPS